MEPNWQLSNKMENNVHDFQSNFFKRFALKQANSPLVFNEKIKKNYLFPTFYNNVSCSIGIFLCSFKEANKIMLDPQIKPIKMPYGRSLVIFSAYEYKTVYNIKPYNEIAMTIPIMVKSRYNIPILPMLMSQHFKDFGYYVFSMPVTSFENEVRGQKIWGLPKKTTEITIEIDKNYSKVATSNKEGEYFKMKIPAQGSKKHFDVSSPLYSRKEHKILKSYTCFKGTFNITKNMKLIFTKKLDKIFPSNDLSYSSSEDNSILKQLDIYPVPIQTRYCSNMESCFDLPISNYTY